jgi:hypothetical protein
MMDGLRTFDGAVAIVTGAASGIGKAIAKTLAARGSTVVLTDIDHAYAEAAARQIREHGGRASAHHLDVTDAREFDEVVSETVGRLGRLDYVFNNAGIGVAGEVGEHTLEAWDRILGVNLKGVIHGIQFAYPSHAAAGLRPHREHCLDGRPGDAPRLGQLHGHQARRRRALEGVASRGVVARDSRERALSRRDPHPDTGGRSARDLPGVRVCGGAAEGRARVLRAVPPDARRDVRAEGARSDRAQPGDHHRARVVAGLLVDGAGRAPSLWAFLGRKGYERARARLLAGLADVGSPDSATRSRTRR